MKYDSRTWYAAQGAVHSSLPQVSPSVSLNFWMILWFYFDTLTNIICEKGWHLIKGIVHPYVIIHSALSVFPTNFLSSLNHRRRYFEIMAMFFVHAKKVNGVQCCFEPQVCTYSTGLEIRWSEQMITGFSIWWTIPVIMTTLRVYYQKGYSFG